MIRVLAVLAASAILGFGVLWFFQRNFIFPAPPARTIHVPGYDRVTLATADGLALTALYRPATPDKPTLVFFHGNADTLEGSASAVAGPVAAGYGALLPEYRGYGGNPGKPGEAGFYADARAAHGFLQTQGVDDADIVLIGNSIGSGAATQLATEADFGGLALVSAYTDLPSVVASVARWLPLRWLVKDRFDNHAKLRAVRAPVLVMHGELDQVIAYDHGETLGGAPGVDFVGFPGVGHELAYLPRAQAKLVEWLAQNHRQHAEGTAKAAP